MNVTVNILSRSPERNTNTCRSSATQPTFLIDTFNYVFGSSICCWLCFWPGLEANWMVVAFPMLATERLPTHITNSSCSTCVLVRKWSHLGWNPGRIVSSVTSVQFFNGSQCTIRGFGKGFTLQPLVVKYPCTLDLPKCYNMHYWLCLGVTSRYQSVPCTMVWPSPFDFIHVLLLYRVLQTTNMHLK